MGLLSVFGAGTHPAVKRALLLLCGWLALAAGPRAQAAGEGTEPVASTAASASSQLSRAEVERLAETAKQTPGLDDAAKVQLETLYKQALTQLELEAEWQAKCQESEALRKQAPERLQELKAQLLAQQALAPVALPPGKDLAAAELELSRAAAERDQALRELAELEAENARRKHRRAELPQLTAAARDRLAAPPDAPAASLAPVERQARETLALARRQAIASEIQAYEHEVLSYESRVDLLQLRLELADARALRAEELADLWSRRVDELRSEAAEAAVREAEARVLEVHPALRELAEHNAALTRARVQLSQAIEASKKRQAELEDRSQRLDEDFRRIQERMEAAGLTDAIGLFLRKQRGGLPNVRQLQRGINRLKDEIGSVQVRLIELEEQRASLGKPEAILAGVMSALGPELNAPERRRIERQAQELVQGQREQLNALIDAQGGYFSELVDRDGVERALLAKTRKFARYINEHVLWVRSGPQVWGLDPAKPLAALRWLVDPQGWAQIQRSVWGTLRAHPLLTLLAAVGLVLLLIGGRWLRRRLENLPRRGADGAGAVFLRTLAGLTYSVALAARWPALLWFAAWLLASPYDSSEFAKAIAEGLWAGAMLWFSIELVRKLCAKNGPGARFFQWPAGVRNALTTDLGWLRWTVVPTSFLVGVMQFQPIEAYRETLGRAAFIVSMLAFALYTQRLLRPSGALMPRLLAAAHYGWLSRLRPLWYGLAVGGPVALALGALVGYFYTAHYLSWRVVETFYLLLGVVLIGNLVHRWLQLRVSHRARQQELDAEPGEAAGDGMRVALEDGELDQASVSAQANKLLLTLVVVTALGGVWMIWSEALPALTVFDQVTLWNTTVETTETLTRPDGTSAVSKLTRQVPTTLADLGLALLIVVVTFVATRNLPGLLDIALLAHLPLSPSSQYAITSLTKYVLAAVGIVLAFNAIGVDWAKVQWLVAAMTVGLAFGLQEIFANFVSGIIILFERPIRVGDVVTVGNVSGVVSRIRIRATTITDWDRKELIVPNKRFITTEILNWTLSDAIIRVVFPVAVSRGVDAERVRNILLELARKHPLVLPDPEPSVVFAGFGSGALRFDLRVFIRREDYAQVLDAVNSAINEALAASDIEMAVDRQEIQVRPAKQPPHPDKPMSFPPEER